ncbi:MAG TPA: hypothetical protein VKA84_25740 [Gemmatimonadaceae bacterium]|nr:hypothetical protein [Gemmatimonadaceae bacterium]
MTIALAPAGVRRIFRRGAGLRALGAVAMGRSSTPAAPRTEITEITQMTQTTTPRPGSDYQSRGAGVSGEQIDARVDINYITESRREPGGPRVERLVGVAVWRGREGWLGGSWVGDLLAGVWGRLRGRPPEPRRWPETPEGWVAAGANFGAAWTLYDPQLRVLRVLEREYPVPDDDRALVLLIDRADGAGGPPLVTAHAIAAPPRARREPDAATLRDAAARARTLVEDVRARDEGWRALVRGDPTVRAFIEGRSD